MYGGPSERDAFSTFLGLRFDSAAVVRLEIRSELVNGVRPGRHLGAAMTTALGAQHAKMGERGVHLRRPHAQRRAERANEQQRRRAGLARKLVVKPGRGHRRRAPPAPGGAACAGRGWRAPGR